MSALPLSTPLLPELPPGIASQITTAAGLGRTRFAPAHLPTGCEGLDRLLGGGLPRGSLVEMSGRASSGRFSVALSVLASATQAGEAVALVDPGDHFDPQGAAAAGAELARILWLRPRGVKMALAATETVLATGFALVVLDLGLARVSRRRFDDAVWLRLARRARLHDAALFVLSPYRVTGTAARIVLVAEAARATWNSAQGLGLSLLDGLSSRLVAEKNLEKHGAQGTQASLLNLSLLDAVQAGKEERKEKEERKKDLLRREEGKAAAFGR